VPSEVALFLALGVGISVASKLLQFVPGLHDQQWLGNVIVLPAGAFLMLALLLALPPYRELQSAQATRPTALWLAALACAAMLSFQLLTMSVVGGRMQGILFVVPLLGAAGGFAVLWLRTSNPPA